MAASLMLMPRLGMSTTCMRGRPTAPRTPAGIGTAGLASSPTASSGNSRGWIAFSIILRGEGKKRQD